jgi:hypothetical protein
MMKNKNKKKIGNLALKPQKIRLIVVYIVNKSGKKNTQSVVND